MTAQLSPEALETLERISPEAWVVMLDPAKLHSQARYYGRAKYGGTVVSIWTHRSTREERSQVRLFESPGQAEKARKRYLGRYPEAVVIQVQRADWTRPEHRPSAAFQKSYRGAGARVGVQTYSLRKDGFSSSFGYSQGEDAVFHDRHGLLIPADVAAAALGDRIGWIAKDRMMHFGAHGRRSRLYLKVTPAFVDEARAFNPLEGRFRPRVTEVERAQDIHAYLDALVELLASLPIVTP